MFRFLLILCLVGYTLPASAQSRRSTGKVGASEKARKAAEVLSREDVDRHRAALLKDVGEISTPGVPGPLVVYGPNAFPVVIDQRDGETTVMVAAATLGKGRLVALSHDGYLGKLLSEHMGTGKLMQNVLLWAAGLDPSRAAELRVAVLGRVDLVEWLQSGKVSVKALSGPNWVAQLTGVNVVVADIYDASQEELSALEGYVRKGGGFVAGNLIWGWEQGHPGADPLVDHGGNRLYSRAGIAWANGYAPANYGAKVKVDSPLSDYVHIGWALDALTEATDKQRPLEPADRLSLESTFRHLIAIPRDGDQVLFDRVKGYLQKNASKIPIPGPESPIRRKQPDDRLIVSMEAAYFQHLPVEQLQPHPAAESFPGAPPKTTKRVTQKVELDLSQHGWKSTGLYAVPGKAITIKLDQSAITQGFVAQIGCHTDLLWGNDEWRRTPQMVRRFPLRKVTQKIGHALGGPIYIIVPEKAGAKTLTVEFGNAVEAPYYVLGRTTLADWRKSLQHKPAPWAELECDRVIISVPSSLVRELDDPEALMTHWRAVLDACADLRGIQHERQRPERFVFDRQISVGFLHAGYPIMGHLDPSAREIVDLRHLQTKGGWGFYHELGHNHQLPEWTFNGTLEVTCNWFTLYVHEMLTPQSYTLDEVQSATKDKLERQYVAGGAPFEKWKSDPFLALILYQQLRDGFGWDAYKRVLAEYRDLPADERPKTEIEKHDQWMVRFSRTVGKNLGPFCEYWGLPTSEEARKSIANLPAWMPEGRPLK